MYAAGRMAGSDVQEGQRAGAADKGAGADARRKVSGRLRAGMRDHAQRGGQNDRADVRAEGEDGL